MTITLPEKLETKIRQLFPQKEEREAFLSSNLEGLMEMLSILNDQQRSQSSLRILKKAKARAEQLREQGITTDEAFTQLRDKVSKLDLN